MQSRPFSILRVLISLSVLSLGLGAVSAQADTFDVNWIGPTGMGGNGNWSAAADWSNGGVPSNGGGNTYNVTLPDYSTGNYTVNLDISPTIDGLTVGLTPASRVHSHQKRSLPVR
jgi:hypothetical protein